MIERSTAEGVTMTLYHRLKVAALLWAASTVAARAEDYVVHWTVVEHDVTPVPQAVSQGYVARFSSDGSRFVTDEGGETVAGQPAFFVTKLGTRHAIVYTQQGRSIIRTDTFPGFSVVMRIAPDGAGGCHVDIRYSKIRGDRTFDSKRNDGSGPSTAARVGAANARCTTVVPQS